MWLNSFQSSLFILESFDFLRPEIALLIWLSWIDQFVIISTSVQHLTEEYFLNFSSFEIMPVINVLMDSECELFLKEIIFWYVSHPA